MNELTFIEKSWNIFVKNPTGFSLGFFICAVVCTALGLYIVNDLKHKKNKTEIEGIVIRIKSIEDRQDSQQKSIQIIEIIHDTMKEIKDDVSKITEAQFGIIKEVAHFGGILHSKMNEKNTKF